MKKQIFIALIVVVAAFAYAVFQIGSTGAAPSSEVSYAKDVYPILKSRCASCHMGEFVSEDLDMDTYESLMKGSQNGPVVVPGDVRDSLLVKMISEGKMPKRGPKLTPAQIQTIRDWIDAGAPNN